MMSESVQPPAEVAPPLAPPAGEEAGRKPVRWGVVAMWSAIVLLMAALGWGLINSNKARPEPGQMAPDFDLEFFNGYEWESRPTASLADMRGKVVVLNFWAAWCIECRLEADLLEASWQKYRAQDVVFLGVAWVDPEPNSLAYLEEFNISYPNAPDLRTAIGSDYEITGVPETFFIGKDGVINHVQIGPVRQTMLDGLIGQMLNQGG